MGLLCIAVFCMGYGLYSVVSGKIPMIKKYHGIKKQKLHCRIEGGAVLLTGVLILLQPILQMSKTALVISIVGLAVLAIVLEVVLKVI